MILALLLGYAGSLLGYAAVGSGVVMTLPLENVRSPLLRYDSDNVTSVVTNPGSSAARRLREAILRDEPYIVSFQRGLLTRELNEDLNKRTDARAWRAGTGRRGSSSDVVVRQATIGPRGGTALP